MPKILPEEDIETAHAAVEYAQSVRRLHRRRTEKGSLSRENDIQLALDRLKDAMAPLRSAIGSFPYGAQTETAERNREAVLTASDAIQRERRKLWKMRKKAK